MHVYQKWTRKTWAFSEAKCSMVHATHFRRNFRSLRGNGLFCGPYSICGWFTKGREATPNHNSFFFSCQTLKKSLTQDSIELLWLLAFLAWESRSMRRTWSSAVSNEEEVSYWSVVFGFTIVLCDWRGNLACDSDFVRSLVLLLFLDAARRGIALVAVAVAPGVLLACVATRRFTVGCTDRFIVVFLEGIA